MANFFEKIVNNFKKKIEANEEARVEAPAAEIKNPVESVADHPLLQPMVKNNFAVRETGWSSIVTPEFVRGTVNQQRSNQRD